MLCNCMLSVTRLGKTNKCLVVNVRGRSGGYCELTYCLDCIEGCKRTVVTSGGCNRTAVTLGGCNRTAVTLGGCNRTAVISGNVTGLQ